MKIRNAVASDVRNVKILIEELEDIQMESAEFESIFLEYIERKNALVWVVENNELEVIGFVSCFGQRLIHHLNWVYEIQELIITKSYQNKGIGKILIEKLVEEMKKRNVFSLEVTTNKKRIAAHEFYSATGFLNSHEKFTMYFQ